MRRAQAKGVAQLLAARICLDGRHFFGIQRQQVVPAFISNSSADHSLVISRYVRAESLGRCFHPEKVRPFDRVRDFGAAAAASDPQAGAQRAATVAVG